MAVGILGLGSCIPREIVSNKQISEWADVPEGWIEEHTGIFQRHYASPGVPTSELAVQAGREALRNTEIPAGNVKAIMVATSTPDQPIPSTAMVVQEQLKLSGAAAFDINAACSGFVYGVALAGGMLEGQDRNGAVLVVGADLYSRLMNRSDRRTVALFGDAAGAALFGHVPEGYGIRSCRLVSHGEHADYIGVRAGGTRQPLDGAAREAGDHLLFMAGRNVREYALNTMPKVIGEALDGAGLKLDDIGRMIFHQANARLVEEFRRSLGVERAKVPTTAPLYGNTGAASVPLTMHLEHQRNPFRRGEHLVLAAVGAGMTAGAAVVTWY